MTPKHLRSKFEKVFKDIVKSVRKENQKELNDKISWLKKKWKPIQKEPPSEIQGIKLGDEDINRLNDEQFDPSPRIYGGVKLSENELYVTELPPKFGLLPKIDPVQCRIQVEKCLNQIRWRKHIKDDTRTLLFDNESKEIDINNLRPTDLHYNNDVSMPAPVCLEEEMRFQTFKNDVKDIAKKMERKSKRYGNLDEKEKQGLKSLKDKTSNEEVICFTTDKSGRWAVDSKDNYKLAVEKHLVTGVQEITWKQHDNLEKYLNCHMLALLRMLGLKNDKNGDRIRISSTTSGCVIAPFYALRKDHKKVEAGKEVEGPKTRGVCGARDSVNMRISHLLSMILKELIPHNETHCDSTEDLLAKIESLNNELNIDPKWKIISLDIESLYPSLDISKCSEIIANEMYKSNIQIKNIKWKEVMLYLRFMLNDEQIRKYGLWDFAPAQRSNRGRQPTFISSGSSLREQERFKPWIFNDSEANESQKKHMFSIALGILVHETITNHVFSYNNVIYKQEEGGAIGLELVGVVAKIYMCWWDKQLIQRTLNENLELVLYKRYEDDCNIIVKHVDVEEIDEEIAKRISRIADTIDHSIKSTYDYGSKYTDGRLPMLDLKLWIDKDHNGTWKVMHTHFMKKVSSKYLIHERSSHPSNMKFNVLVNEGLRICRNISVHLQWDEYQHHLQEFVKRMKFSGYNQHMRARVLEKVLSKRNKRLENFYRTKKMYRSRKEQYDERRKIKDGKKNNWYNRNKYEGIMFVDVSENNELLREVQKAAKKNRLKIKVVEKMRNTIKTELQRSNPFKSRSCNRTTCIVCSLGIGKNIDCRTRGVVYQIECTECNRKYRGQTGRSLSERINEHFHDLSKKKDKSTLFQHSMKHHDGKEFQMEVKILSKCFGEPTARMISEAVLIDELNDNETLNSKTEWNYVKLPRAQLTS